MDSLSTIAPPSRLVTRIAMLGTYPPRQCGIATFSADLSEAMSKGSFGCQIDLLAMTDNDSYDYPENVVFEIKASDRPRYTEAAKFINSNGYDVLSIQHEYGIYGGAAGDYLLDLIRAVNVPIVTTLHTVLDDPNDEQKMVMDFLLRRSDRVIVMSACAIEILARVHAVDRSKVELIHHGIPSIPEIAPEQFRRDLQIDGPMILTFGLLSRDKGIEYVIDAMPKISREFPGATYVVVGATHPHVRKTVGEAYRHELMARAEQLGVSKNVRFIDRYVTTAELIDYLSATDFYVTPYLNPKQITSGTLAYAVGAGKAVISTRYTYANEMLGEGRGELVPFRDAEAIANSILDLCSEPERYLAISDAAAQFGREMIWPEVARRYLTACAKAHQSSRERYRPMIQRRPVLQPVRSAAAFRIA